MMEKAIRWMPCVFKLLRITHAVADVTEAFSDSDGKAGDGVVRQVTKSWMVFLLAFLDDLLCSRGLMISVGRRHLCID